MARARLSLALLIAISGTASTALADDPAALYIFPAGGQRGTTVEARIGGMSLHEECPLHWFGTGVAAPPTIRRVKGIWFEGPVIPLPDSQRQEDYPSEYAASLPIAKDAPLGDRRWRVSTSQGATMAMRFVVGDLPEVVEQEIDGAPIPVDVKLPVTVNGRVFPREDIDEWSFAAKKGRPIRLEVNASRIGSPLDAQLEVVDANGRRLAVAGDTFEDDPMLVFTPPKDGTYRARIFDAGYKGLQTHVYRLTISDLPHAFGTYPLGGKRGATTDVELLGVNLPTAVQPLKIPADAPEAYHAALAVKTLDGAATVTNPLTFETSTYDERLEAEPNDALSATDTSAKQAKLTAPVVANGRIMKAGDVDYWLLDAKKDQPLDLDVRAGRLGSPLDPVLVVEDAEGKLVVEIDDFTGTESDAKLRFAPPADGVYRLRIQERSAHRGGPTFAYRLYVTPAAQPGFQLTFPSDVVTVLRGASGRLKLKCERFGGFADAVALEFDNLPAGVTVNTKEIQKGRVDADLTFQAGDTATIELRDVVVRGKAKVGRVEKMEKGKLVVEKEGVEQVSIATLVVPPPQPNAQTQQPIATKFGDAEVKHLTLAVGIPTPFKSVAVFGLPFATRGSVFFKKFTIERNGFTGPIEVALAEKQMRHLQGVQGRKMTIPSGVDEFIYPVYLPPWMELARTSRSVITLVGIVDDGTGKKHKVSFTSQHQNEQLSLIIAPGRMNLTLTPETLVPTSEMPAEVHVKIDRDAGLNGTIRLELLPATHIKGVSADVVTVPAGENEAVLKLRFTGDAGPFNMPLMIRATHGEGDARIVAETNLEIVK